MPSRDNPSSFRALARSSPSLCAERERELVLQAKRGDVRARDELVRGHMRLVIATVRKLRRDADEDLVAEGVLGLLEALDRFDPRFEVRLSTYAAPWIRVYAQRHVLATRRIVAAPDTRAARKVLARIGRVERRLFATRGEATAEAIAAELGVTPDDVAQVMVAMRSSDTPVGPSREDGCAHEPADASPSPEECVAEAQHRRRLSKALTRALARLPERERAIVCARRLEEEDARTLSDLGAAMDLSSERVRQLELRALRKLGEDLRHLAA